MGRKHAEKDGKFKLHSEIHIIMDIKTLVQSNDTNMYMHSLLLAYRIQIKQIKVINDLIDFSIVWFVRTKKCNQILKVKIKTKIRV